MILLFNLCKDGKNAKQIVYFLFHLYNALLGILYSSIIFFLFFSFELTGYKNKSITYPL